MSQPNYQRHRHLNQIRRGIYEVGICVMCTDIMLFKGQIRDRHGSGGV